MLTCNFCGKVVQSSRGYVLHCKLHRNEPRCFFRCIEAGCKQTYTRYGAFKAHFYRRHSAPTHVTGVAVVSSFTCAMVMCERQCQNSKELIAHLKSHIVEGHVVTCPVRGCTNTFRVKSSFTAHMSRKHRVFRQQHW